MSLSDKNISKKSKLARHIQAALLGGVALQSPMVLADVSPTKPVFSDSVSSEQEQTENSSNSVNARATTPDQYDDDYKDIEYSLSGVDAHLFRVSSGYIYFIESPDFESPSDSDNNNQYQFTVTAKHKISGQSTDKSFTLTVTDAQEFEPLLTITPQSVAEGGALQLVEGLIDFGAAAEGLSEQIRFYPDSKMQGGHLYYDRNEDGILQRSERVRSDSSYGFTYASLISGGYYYLHDGAEVNSTELSFYASVSWNASLRDTYPTREKIRIPITVNATDDAPALSSKVYAQSIALTPDMLKGSELVIKPDIHGNTYASYFLNDKVHFYKFDGSRWSSIGSHDVNGGSVHDAQLLFSSDNSPVFAFLSMHSNGDAVVDVYKYDVTQTQLLKLSPELDSANAYNVHTSLGKTFGFTIDKQDDIYLLFHSRQTTHGRIVKFSDLAGWQDEFLFTEPFSTTSSGGWSNKKIPMDGYLKLNLAKSGDVLAYGVAGYQGTESAMSYYSYSSKKIVDGELVILSGSGGSSSNSTTGQYEFDIKVNPDVQDFHYSYFSRRVSSPDKLNISYRNYSADKSVLLQLGQTVTSTFSATILGSYSQYSVEVASGTQGNSRIIVSSVVGEQFQTLYEFEVPFEVNAHPELSVNSKDDLSIYLRGQDSSLFPQQHLEIVSFDRGTAQQKQIKQSGSASLLLPNYTIEDPDDTEVSLSLEVSPANAGAFKLPENIADFGLGITQDDSNGSLQITGPIADLNQIINKIAFMPAAGYVGQAAIKVDLSNNGNTHNVVNISGNIVDANSAPQRVKNETIAVGEGESVTILNSQLQFTDTDDSASELTYTVQSLPEFGELYLDTNQNDVLESGEKLAAGSQFTQADIDNQLLSYTHLGAEQSSDNLILTLEDGLEDGVSPISNITVPFAVTGKDDPATDIRLSLTEVNQSAMLYNNVFATIAVTDADSASHTFKFFSVSDGLCNDTVFAGLTADGYNLSSSSVLAPGLNQICVEATGSQTSFRKIVTLNVINNLPEVAPEKPSLSPASDKGVSNSDNITSVTRPQFTGTASPGATIQLSSDLAGVIGTAVVDSQGYWSITPANDLNTGTHTITASVMNGQVSGTPSSPLVVVIDTSAPSIGSQATVKLAGHSGSGSAVGNSQRPTFEGKVPGADYVKLTLKSRDGQVIRELGTANVDEQGNWLLSVTENIPHGEYLIDAVVFDNAGNSENYNALVLSIDTLAPAGFNTAFAASSYHATSAALASFNISNAEAGSKYSYTITSRNGGTAVTGSGTIESATQTISPVDLRGLNDGELTLSVTLTDIAGNTSAAQTSFARLDSGAPGIATFRASLAKLNKDGTAVVDIVLGEPSDDFDVSDLEAAGGTLTGFTKLSPTVYQVTYVPAADSSTAGSLKIKAGAFTDAAGNTNTAAPVLNFDIDTQAPNQPNVAVSGTAFNADTIKDGLFRLLGAEQGATYQWTMQSLSGRGAIDTAEQVIRFDSDSNGIQNMNDGTLSLSVTVIDDHGNESQPFTQDIVYENVKPTLQIIAPQGVSGKGPVTLEFVVSEEITGFEQSDLQSSAGNFQNFQALGNNRYSAQYVAAPQASGAVTVSVADGAFKDKAGNQVAATEQQFNVDTLAPAGHSVAMNMSQYHSQALGSASFSFANAEVGANYTYTLTSSGGGKVSGSGTINSATDTVNILDMHNLKDGSLMLNVILTDTAGNQSNTVMDSADLDTVAPQVHAITASKTAINASETSVITITLSEASSNFSMASLAVSSGELSGYTAVNDIGTQYQVIFTPAADSESTGSVTVKANTFNDTAGNINTEAKSVELNVDTQAPTGYAVTLDKAVYNSSASTIRFDLSGGEAGATYAYTLSSDGHSVTGTGTLDSAQQQVVITDIENLNDGPLSLSVTLTDKAGNAGVAAMDTATLDTVAPSGHEVTLDQQTYNLANRDAASFSFSGAEVGATYAYTLTSTGGGELTGAETITAANQQVNIANLSQLKDGTLSLSVVLTDSAGNAAQALVKQAKLDATAPTITTLSASQSALKAGETSVITIGLSEAVVDFNKTSLNVAGGTVSELEQISDTSYRTVFTPSENSQAAGTIAIAAGKFSDAAGNPNLASDTLTLNIDTQAPGNHSVAFGAPYYHGTNANAASITLSDAEVGTRYHYVISSAQGGLPVSVHGDVTESNQTISGINLSNLNDGQLNVTVTLTDPAGNVSEVASGTAILDTAAPQVVSLKSNDLALKAGEQAQITIVLSEPSADFTQEDIVASSGSLSEFKALNATTYQATFTPDTNVEGDVTISIAAGVFNDAAGNANTAAQPLVLSQDTTAPSGQSVSIDQTLINRDNETAMSFTLNGLEGKGMLTYQVSDGTTSVGSQSPISITAATQSVTGVDVSALAEGRLILTVVVYDDANNAGEPVTAAVTKKYNVAPVLSGTPHTTVNEDAEYVFEPQLTDPDSDDTHTFVISNKPDWASFDEQTGKLSGTPGDEHVGNYEQIVITVNDGKAEHALNAFNIEVVNTNDAPVAQDFSFTLDEAEQLVIASQQGLLSSATDDDLDSEDSLSAVVVSQPQYGTLLLNADGSFTYTHDGSENHSDSFTYQVKDAAGELSQTRNVALTINPLADAPVTLDDTLTVTEDTPNTIDLLENDSDAENDMVAASAAVVTEPQLGSYTITNGKLTYTPNENATGQDTLTYTVKDAAGNTSKAATLTISIVAVNDQPVAKGATLTVEEDTPSDELDVRTLSSDIEDTHPQGEVALSVLPTKGVVTVNQESGKLVYTPNANATGSDAFSYTIADSEGLVSEPVEVIVNIGAVNDRPVAAGDSVTINEDETGTLNILNNDTDVEDQGFNGANVMLEDKGNGAGAYTLADVTVLADGQLEITPKADVNGSFSFTYTLMDSEGLSSEPATVNVDITPVNDAPVATDNTAQLEEEGSYEVNVLGDDYDVDANDQLDPGSVTVVRQPQSGQVTVTDSGAIVYVPNAHFNGLDTFTYTVKDAAGAVSNEALVTMTVTPVNDAPVADAQVLNVAEDGSVLITLTATDIDADALSYQIVQGVNSGTLTQQSENSWLYTPDTDFNGEDSLQFVAFDGQAESEPVQVTLNVTAVNDAPVITGTPATGVDQDTAYRFTPDASDLDVDSLTFSIENQPVWASFDAQSGTLSGTPGRDDVGNYANIVISVSDGELTASLPAFAIQVGYVNAKPVAQTMQVFVDEDASTSFSAPVTDTDQDSLSITVTQQPASGTLSVQGTLFSYIPGANFNGSDSFSYVVNDGEMNSDEAQVSITVNAVNDTPVAQNDAFSFGDVASSYSLDVLANDSDVDAGDTLTLVGASASIGSVSISDGQLVYQPQASAQDTAVITYMLADSAGARAQATATVEITASAAANGPTLSVPNDMSVDATGLFTKVDLGTASAFDSNGNPLAVSLVDGVTIFAPGLHQVYWKATDGNDQSTVKKQTLAVNPLVSLSKDSQIAEEQSHTVKVFLNGPAPSYPVTVPYTVTGSADGNDHDLLDGEVVIESGTEASITFNVFADGIAEGNESIVITLADTLNRGAKSSSTVTIVEDNVAPALTVNTTQSGESRTLIVQNGESVVVSAAATDANPQDSITLSWEAADAQMTDLSFEAGRFEFDPSVLAAGIYKLSVTATDDGTPALSATQDIYLEVVESLPQLSSVDSDGDLIPDDQEGFADSDNDGIPDYLDANSDCNVIPGQVKDANQYLVEGEPGVCLRKGATVAQNSTGGAQLLETELPADSEATNIGGVFDFIATGLPKAGDVYGIVIPQRKPIPVNAIYRKFRDGEWVNFVTTDGNAILSATGEPGYCPPPGSNEWRDGLNEGDWCVQLQIVDGGPNDDDGIANRSIVDPGGIAVLMSDNTQPVAQADTLTVGAGLPVFINVLENDSDADGDTLTITGASADFGEVEILDNQLRYTPPVDYVGTATITYSIADGQGGTSSATVTVELVVNAAPVTLLDTASTNDQASVILDVLANDMDPDGDALTLISATATHGNAVVNLDGTLSYEPKLGFNGEDTVTYQVKDAKGATSTGIAKINVTAHQVATVENKSSGSLGGLLMVMVSALVLRRRKSALPAYAVVTASCLVSAPALADAWRVQATLGQAEANSQFSALPAGTQVSNVDDSSQSWSAGAFYQLMPKWYAGLRYIDLGQGRVTLSGSTLTPDSWHQSMARVAPVLPEGFALQTGLEVARFDKVHGELFLGAYNWDYQIDSTLNGRHFVQYEQKGTSAYFGGAVGYQLSDSTALTLSYSHYRLSANRIGEVAAGIEVRF
ncbi:Ig-like domain-containing protein [Pseudoalteromonas rubra]|uniref:Ig-like domain-containing protein n=1 Tax=Pseudoalteromonas rubra TaxID=43658 RepID=UPI000F773A8B|nr:Ig-like domain-containing protein [Pseudoalteromonas rubra]